MTIADFVHIYKWSLRRRGKKVGVRKEKERKMKKWPTVFKFKNKNYISVKSMRMAE